MPDPTPGQIAYAAYWRVDPWTYDVPWAGLTPAQRQAWEAAAQAVQSPPQQPPVCAHCQMPYTWKCSCDCEEESRRQDSPSSFHRTEQEKAETPSTFF